MPKRMLIPLDGSDLARAALEPAADLAESMRAEVVLLRVVDSANYPYVFSDPATWKDPGPEIERDRVYLESEAAELRERGIKVEISVVVGSPATAIAVEAEKQRADLIAMATHGRGGLARLVLGSVAEAVLHRVHVPMLLIRPEQMRRRPPA